MEVRKTVRFWAYHKVEVLNFFLNQVKHLKIRYRSQRYEIHLRKNPDILQRFQTTNRG